MIKLRKKQKGFTLVELLIVIAIIAVLAAVVTPVALSAVADSRATAVYAEIKSIETADLTYFVQNEGYAADLESLDLAGLVGNKTKNAEYTIDGDATLRTLTVKITNGASVADVATQAGVTLVSGVGKFSDNFEVTLTKE